MKTIKLKNSKEEIPVGKIVCVGRNYAAHAEELGNEVPSFPIIFLKTSSCIIYDGDNIVHPDYSENLHYEAELVVLIGKEVKDADDESAAEAIGGYAVGLDMTLRDLQNQFREKGNPWTLAKAFDTSAVLSGFVSSADINLTGEEKIELKVNGVVRQNSPLNLMLFPPVEIIKYISHRLTLEPGDLIYTGTPAGVGRVIPGDVIETKIDNIGTLKNAVVKG